MLPASRAVSVVYCLLFACTGFGRPVEWDPFRPGDDAFEKKQVCVSKTHCNRQVERGGWIGWEECVERLVPGRVACVPVHLRLRE